MNQVMFLITAHSDLQVLLLSFGKYKCPFKHPSMPIHAMLNFLKTCRTKQNFTRHVPRAFTFQKV